MERSKYFLSHLNLINIILITVFFFLLFKSLSFVSMSVEYTVPSINKASVSEAEDQKRAPENSVPLPSDYIIIAEQNLFHPGRKALTGIRESASLHGPDFVLYGTLMTEDVKIAFLDDLKAPYSTPGRGKRQWALSVGDELSGYTLSEVYHDRVVMVSGSGRIELAVIDFSKPKVRDTETITTKKTGNLKVEKIKKKKKDKKRKPRTNRKKKEKKDDN